MGFLCINKNSQKNVSQTEVSNQNFLRDNGLSNVYNIHTDINCCREIFLSPQYYVEGGIKLISGYTSTLTACTSGFTGIYNLDYTGDIGLNFIITGSTGFTNYVGNFCIKTFPKSTFQPTINTGLLINGSEITSDCYPFSGITSSITKTFTEGTLPKTWAEYLVRPYYTFKSKTCNVGYEFNSWDNTLQYNSFQSDTDYYFMTVVNPSTPVLSPPIQNGGVRDNKLITDKLYVNGVSTTRGSQSINGNLNYFILSSIPTNGQILLMLNGVQLTQEYDFRLIEQGYGVPPIVEVLNNEIKTTDWLLATYIAGAPNSLITDFGIYFIDTILLDGFTNTTTTNYRVSGDNTLNYNPTTLNYELYTSLPIDPTYATILTVNGVSLVEDSQYFKSTSFDGRIIFNKNVNFNIGDVISILAVSKNSDISGVYNYGSISKNEFLVKWAVPTTFTNDTVTGRFIVQAYNKDTNILTNQKFVDYVSGQSNYESLLTNLPLNVSFKFKVVFEATYTGYLNNKVITCSEVEGYFDTKNEYINNTY